MVLEFDMVGNDKICGGFDSSRNKLAVDRCDKITTNGASVLSYHDDMTVRSRFTGQCLTRQEAIQTELTFESCKPNSEVQKFAFEDQNRGLGAFWPALVPVAGATSGAAIHDTCLITNWPQRLTEGGPAGVYLWACRASWEYTPDKAIKMLRIADCAKNEVGTDGKCVVVTRPPLSQPVDYMDRRMRLFKNDADIGKCAVARMGWLGEWVSVGDCFAQEITATGNQRRLSTFTLAVLDFSTTPIVEIMTADARGHDGMCAQVEWGADFSSGVRRRLCNSGETQRWILKPVWGKYERYRIQSTFTPPGKGPQCLDVAWEDRAYSGQLLALKDCSASNGATWEVREQY